MTSSSVSQGLGHLQRIFENGEELKEQPPRYRILLEDTFRVSLFEAKLASEAEADVFAQELGLNPQQYSLIVPPPADVTDDKAKIYLVVDKSAIDVCKWVVAKRM